MKRNWDSSQIIRCSCSELSYTHVHCPCSACKGKAVSSSVEFRHRQRIDLRQDLTSLPETEHEDVEDVASETSSSEATSESDCIVEKEENLACDDSGLNMQTNTSDVQNLEQDIVFALCKGFMLVNQMQGSINDFDEVLVFARDLFCRNDPSLCNLWPKNWKETEKLFKKWDYKEPRMYIICLDDSHPCHWDVMESASIRCRHCNKFGTIKYYYLGLPDKIRTWYSDSTMCKKMLAHWLNKDNWISGVGANLELSEVWDGTRFSELAWFWDPDKEWMLPYKCKYCLNVISVEEIVGFPERDGIYTIQCEDCGEKSEYQPQFARGEPRNIGLIGHWDGWQPFGSPGKHSCGAIEVSIANMNKQDRSAIEEVYVIGFVPNYLLPKKRPCSLDPFLHPLISDIESIFINGYRVDYVGDFPEINIRPGNIVVRVLLLLWTGDYVAQCEIGKFIKCGIKACRRDKLTGTINPNGGTNYYYGQNRFHARFHWEERKISEELKQMQEISEEDRPSIRKRLSRESGYTGLSILHRLHKLYGFDVLKDTVFDVMHNLPLNIVKDQLMKLITDEKFDVIEADERLSKFPWTCELKNGRIPLGLTSRVAHWKSEEWQKFAYPASELILAGLLPPADYHLWQLAVRMTQLIFNHRSQWSHEDVLLFSNLANRYIILNEEQQGITACRITVHNLQHISEDALRFSHPDNYWCFPFERAVQRYVSTSSNFKNIECSFAKRESYRELMKLVSAKTEQQRQVPHVKFDLQKMSASSLEAAKHIQLLCHSNTEYAESFQSGVLIGGMLSNDVLLSEEEMDLIKHSLSPSLSVPELGFRYRAFWKPMPSPNGMLFRKNECVILKDDDGSDDEVVCQVEYYLCVQVDNSFVKFVKVSAYSAELDEESNTLYDPYSGGMFIDTTNVKTLLAPATSIDRKVILYNCNDDAHPNRGIVVDFQREVMAITYSDIQVPFYPKCEDMVLIKGDGPDPWLAKVLSIQENRKTAKVWYYREHLHRQHLYVPYPNQRQAQDFVHWDSILCLAPVRHAACNLSFLANAFEATEHTYRKQLVMAAKTGKAWLECDDYAMADNSLQLATECWASLQDFWSTRTDRLLSHDQERHRAESEQYMFSVQCYRTEAAFHMSQNDKTHSYFEKAKDMLQRLPKENARLSILGYNFGVSCYHNKEYADAIEWLKESYELGKGKKPVGNKKQAVTLRLMARVYLDWDREEHLQKALNAVGLANSEHPHPAGHYLKVELLLIDNTSTSSLQPVLDEALRHPDLNVQMGLNIVNLVIQYQRTASAFECLRLLANRFQNSPDLAKIQLSHLELLLNGKQTQEAKEVVEDCISGHNTGRPLDEETRKMFHILLWEKAAAFYDGKDFQEALAWYNYSLSLFTSEEKDGNKNLAKLLRNKCSCLIMLEEYSKAREVAAESVTIDPDSPLTHFYQFKIALMEGDDELAIQTIGKMKDIGKKPQNNCVTVDSADDVHALVCLAAQLSLEQNNREVGIRALESLVKTSSSSKQIITALRCLIRLKLTLGENENRRDLGSIQSYLQRALDSINNMSCVGEDIHIEAMWFMKIAWNMALDSIETLQEMREFFLISHKFADLCPIETSNITRQKSCQLMASAASLQIAQETSDEEQKRNALKQALSHVQSCRDLCRPLSAGKQTGGKDDIAVLLVLYEFEAKVKLGESNASLESCLQKAMALPQCEAQTFETLAALAVEHPAYNKDICMKSLRIAVKKHKTSGHTDCTKLSKVYHSLVEIALNNGSSSDANSKEEAWKIYEEILDFMEGKIKGSYPEMEAIWLMTKAWNCGIHLFSSGHVETAEKWCGMAMRLLQQLNGFKNNYESKMTSVYSETLDRIEKSSLQTVIEE